MKPLPHSDFRPLGNIVSEAPAPPAPPLEEPVEEVQLKTGAAFAAEYEPISYTVEPFIPSGSLYTLTAKTGAEWPPAKARRF
jgi:hypothetical protein